MVSPEKHKSFFATSDGWGSYSQVLDGPQKFASISVRWGEVGLKVLELGQDAASKPLPQTATVELDGKKIAASISTVKNRLIIKFDSEVKIGTDKTLKVIFSPGQ